MNALAGVVVGMMLGFILIQATRAVWKLDDLLRLMRDARSQGELEQK